MFSGVTVKWRGKCLLFIGRPLPMSTIKTTRGASTSTMAMTIPNLSPVLVNEGEIGEYVRERYISEIFRVNK